MSDLNQVIYDYGAAWQEMDADRRLELLTRCFADTGQYSDPTAAISGRQNLCVHIGEVLQSAGGRVEITSAPNSHHDVVHFTWHMVADDGSKMVEGHDFVRLGADGKISYLSGFFGDPDPLT